MARAKLTFRAAPVRVRVPATSAHLGPAFDTLALAAELEGPPDNVAACLLGGLTVAWTDADGARAVGVDVDPTIAPVAFVPGSSSSTKATRKLLPDTVPHADAVRNAGRVALLV